MRGVNRHPNLRKITRENLRAEAEGIRDETWYALIASVHQAVTALIEKRAETHPSDPYLDRPAQRQDFVLDLLPILREKYFQDVDPSTIQ